MAKQRARMVTSGKDAVRRFRFPDILLEILNNKVRVYLIYRKTITDT
jgi:hypothetical protein